MNAQGYWYIKLYAPAGAADTFFRVKTPHLERAVRAVLRHQFPHIPLHALQRDQRPDCHGGYYFSGETFSLTVNTAPQGAAMSCYRDLTTQQS